MNLLGINETALALKIGRNTLYKIIDEKNIKTHRVGKRIAFDNEQARRLQEAVIEHKRMQSKIKSDATKVFFNKANIDGDRNVHTMNSICMSLRIGKKRLMSHIEKLGITPRDWGVAKIITDEELNKVKKSIQDETDEIYGVTEKKAFVVAEKASETLRERSQVEKPVLQTKQQSFNLNNEVVKNDPPKDYKAYSSLIAKVTELTDENNALVQTLKERTEILEKKKEELRKLSGEMSYLRNQYKELRSYKDDMEVLLKNVRNAFQFLYKL